MRAGTVDIIFAIMATEQIDSRSFGLNRVGNRLGHTVAVLLTMQFQRGTKPRCEVATLFLA
jgi:hypothetical protein